MAHWYTNTGELAYTQPNKSKPGEFRNTNLGDAKKLGLFKSVTTVLQIPSKPMLNTWLEDQILEACLKHGLPDYFKANTPEDAVKQWKGKIREESQKIGKDSAILGSKIHDALESTIKNQGILVERHDLHEYIEPAFAILESRIDLKEAIAEGSTANKEHRYGGKVDLHSRVGDGYILDFKTKNKDVVDKKTPYFENCMQLAAYRLALDLPKAKCYNLYISTTKPGAVYFHEWTEEEVKKGERMFLLLNEYFDLSNNLI